MAAKTLNENQTLAIAGVIMNAQHQLRALHALAQMGPSGAPENRGGVTNEHITVLAEAVSVRVYSMLDSCLEHLGTPRIGHFEDAVSDQAEACGIEIPEDPRLRAG